MKLTAFGKVIRKLRIEHNLLLGQMASKIGISSAYLSSIELGERNIPKDFLEKMKVFSEFTKDEFRQIEKSITDSIEEFIFTPKTDYQRELMASLARGFDNLTPDQADAIFKTLNQKKGGNNE